MPDIRQTVYFGMVAHSIHFVIRLTNAVVLSSGASLESQVLGPPVNSAEMAHAGRDWADIANRMTNSKPLALAAEVPAGLRNWIGE